MAEMNFSKNGLTGGIGNKNTIVLIKQYIVNNSKRMTIWPQKSREIGTRGTGSWPFVVTALANKLNERICHGRVSNDAICGAVRNWFLVNFVDGGTSRHATWRKPRQKVWQMIILARHVHPGQIVADDLVKQAVQSRIISEKHVSRGSQEGLMIRQHCNTATGCIEMKACEREDDRK
jgi:hypothetical protein